MGRNRHRYLGAAWSFGERLTSPPHAPTVRLAAIVARRLSTVAGGHAPEARLIGGPVQENKEKAAKANPITYVTKDSAPFLIMHGEEDNVVPISQSGLLDESLRKAGVECTFVRIPGNGHGGPGFASPENRKRIEEFFEKHLK
jgi:dipeptidyl aminopeptidase/acylaminoacyl peptidase